MGGGGVKKFIVVICDSVSSTARSSIVIIISFAWITIMCAPFTKPCVGVIDLLNHSGCTD